MATEKEEIILEFKVDQSDLLKEAAESKKAILGIKDAQTELNKQFKDGKVGIDQYAKESVKLENQLKKEQQTYSSLNKSINTVSGSLDAQRLKLADLTRERNKLDKTTTEGIKKFDQLNREIKELNENIKKHEQAGGDFRRNVGNYTNSIKEAIGATGPLASGIDVAGGALMRFANPAGAAVGIVTALGAAYAASSAGARDLTSATDQLSASIGLASNRFGSFIDKAFGGDGSGKDGIFSKLAFAINSQLLNISDAALAKLSADSKRLLKELELSQLEAQRKAKEALDVAEELRRVRDDEDKDLQDRLAAANDVTQFINERESALVQVQQDRLKQLELLLTLDKENLELKKEIKQTEFEIADIQEDSEGKRTEALNGILALEKQINAERSAGAQSADINRRLTGSNTTDSGANSDAAIKSRNPVVDQESQTAKATIAIKKRLAKDIDKINQASAKEARIRKEEELEAYKVIEQTKLAVAADGLSALAGMFQEGSDLQRFFGLASIGVDTGEAIAALTAASEANPANTVTFGGAGIAQYAAGLIRIFANIASAKKFLSAAAGGGDFVTKGPSLLMVGDNPGGVERVTVEPISGKGQTKVAPNGNLIAMAGGGSLTTFNDGGFAKNTMSASADQSLMMANALKNMPVPEISIKEVTDVQNRIAARERSTKIGRR